LREGRLPPAGQSGPVRGPRPAPAATPARSGVPSTTRPSRYLSAVHDPGVGEGATSAGQLNLRRGAGRFRLGVAATAVPVALVVLLGASGLAFSATAAPEPPIRNLEAPTTCSSILAVYPGINSTMFQEICALPAFQSALQEWGVSNFTAGGATGANWSIEYFGFFWIGSCLNSTWAGVEPQCSDQEYWAANLTSGMISGPILSEGPITCACPAAEAPGTPPIIGGILVAAVVAGAVLALVVILVRRKVRPPSAPPPPSLAPAGPELDHAPPLSP
jgi:hypothetical protein